ncbi:putative AlkP superfamily pyrophosphatase or phosphodiesterase [Mesonia hippocampi]|uniref:Putative AlkP superfamily pyrophosphatase or phosphodiesterase n=1 Tax=Mesonia hippocampi TaxID=1628250 RepID=A0A840EW69_9FLAO|nr:ectonucleotide pyrophosphatase/phosphodiesterase [Mesonia hippocampi]MBB4119796.1 putative AlkP superfamily pyrophosphatase or phosphodiesterase [Mesonia hippocampi]
MKKIISLSLLFIAIASLSAQETKHLVIISIDGFRSDFYKNEKWATANLKFLAKNGTIADDVRTIFPSVTYPSHTTISTGMLPENHGILYNTEISPAGKPGNWYYKHEQVKAKSIWEYAKEKGLTTASVSWPITINNPFIDYNLPEIWSFENPMDRRGATATYATPKGLFEEVEKNATGTLAINEYNLSSFQMDQNLGRMAAYLLETYKPNLLTIHLPNTDGAQHKVGRNGDLVNRAIANADNVVGKIYDALKRAKILENTSIIITGDHGFISTHTAIAPNVWLKNAGLYNKAFFFSTGGSAFLHIRNKNDKKTLKKVKQVLAELPIAEKQRFKIITEKQLRAFKADPNVNLAISAADGYSFTNTEKGAVYTQKIGGKHGYFPDNHKIYTGFIGYGAGFKARKQLPLINLEDIMPTALKLLNINVTDTDGIIVPGLLKQ